jgi:hypothetical protein
MNLKYLAAATALTAAIASPALAMGPHARSEAVQQRQHEAHVYRQGGFWPGDVAAGVIGGAVGTAGAIATAPFRDDTYAYNGYYGRPYPGPYASNFVCQPGTTYVGEDGLRHVCQ